jgi:O-antigen/teichoic acid export membrane protein
VTEQAPAAPPPSGTGLSAAPLGGRFVADVVASLGSRVVILALAFVTSVTIARSLGPEGRGLYAVAVAIGGLGVQFANLGLHAGNTLIVTRRHEASGQVLANTVAVSLGLGGFLAIGAWVAIHALPVSRPLEDPLLAVALLLIPLGLLILLLEQLLLAFGSVGAFNRVEIGLRVGNLAGIGVAWLAGILSAGTAVAISLLSSASFALVAIRLLLPVAGRPISPNVALLREYIGYGLRAYAAAFLAFLVLRIDLLMVDYFRGAADTGQYSIAVSLADLVYLPAVIVGTLLFPRLTAMTDAVARRHAATQVVTATGVAAIFGTFVAVVVARPLIGLIYGGEFEPAVAAFQWLMPAVAFLSVHTLVMTYYAASGMPLVVIFCPLVGLIANVGINLVAIPALGIVGASISSTIAYAVMTMLGVAYFLYQRSDAS